MAANFQRTTLCRIEAEYPDLVLKPQQRERKQAFEDAEHFLPVKENIWKKCFNTLRDHGLYAALEQLSEKGSEDAPWGQSVASWVLVLYRWSWSYQAIGYPHLQLPKVEVADIYSRISCWHTAVIRGIAWHHFSPHLAVARHSGTVEVHHFGRSSIELHSTLKDHRQQNILCLEWAPHYKSMLAVATLEGLFLWMIDLENLSQSRLTPTWVSMETSPAHVPVTSVSWCPYRLNLITCSPCDTSMKLWDISMWEHIDITRYKGGGVTLTKWSPDGLHLFTATPSPMFRVWETCDWTCEQWTNLAGPCTAAAWSPRGETLLFALMGEAAIYSISFQALTSGTSSNAIKCVDLPVITSDADKQTVGVTVKDLKWDKSGTKLAAIFNNSPSLAVFQTRIHPVLEVLPADVIQEGDNYPLAIDFQSFSKDSVHLSVGWSDGVIKTYNLTK